LIEAVKIKWFYALSLLYLTVCGLFVYYEIFWLYLLPVAIALIMLSLLSIDKLIMFTVLVVPLSVELKEKDIGFALSLPAEPLIIAAMILFIFKTLIENSFDSRIWKHPVTISVCMLLMWGLICSVTSEIPLVSVKNMLNKFWFIIPFYFLGIHLFKEQKNVTRIPWMYIIGLVAVVIYTTYSHSLWGFEKDPAHWVMTPFYYDHTQYGAMLAFFVPFLVGYQFVNRHQLFVKILVFLALAAIIVGLILSNSRAAWLSVVIAAGFFIIFVFKIRWYMVAGALGIASVFLFLNWTSIIQKLEKNKQDSSQDFSEHIQSMSNIRTDASNLERLLRWNCALRMYHQRPVFGWGPGTYSFVYAPFQKSYELTIISTNFGDGGNAHSEYLGPLSEQGLLGMLNVILVVITSFYTGAKVIFSKAARHIRLLAMMALLSLITYWFHGFLNNFLDTDKAAVPYWLFVAILVALDIYHVPREAKKKPALIDRLLSKK
jgi:putative inorganic carbon (HCO3(-)) transporter